MAEAFYEPLPSMGQVPWSLDGPIEEIRERISETDDFVSGQGIRDQIVAEAAKLNPEELSDAYIALQMSTVGADTQVELNRATANTYSVDSFGAVGDGIADDTMAINRAINATGTRGGSIIFSSEKIYRTQGGHVFQQGTLVFFNGAVIDHRGNNTCFSFNPDGGFNLDQPTGAYNLNLKGNDGVNAIGVENGANWGWAFKDSRIESYTNGVGLSFPNRSFWTEGYNLDNLHIFNCKTAWRMSRGAGTESFAYGTVRGLAIGVPAAGVGIDVGGNATEHVYLYGATIEATIWPTGNDSVCVRLGPTFTSDNLHLKIDGETFNGDNPIGLKSNEGGVLKAYGHFNIKGTYNVLTGFNRITADSRMPRIDTGSGTDANGSRFQTVLNYSEDTSHDAAFGYLTGPPGTTPFVSAFDQGDVFHVYSVGFNETVGAPGNLVFKVDRTGAIHPGNAPAGMTYSIGSPIGNRAGVKGDFVIQTGSPIPIINIKRSDTGNSDYDAIVPVVAGTTAQRPASGFPFGASYFDRTLGRPIWWDGWNNRWVNSDGATV